MYEKINLFIDDERYPANDGRQWHIVRSYDEAITFLESLDEGPAVVYFDNDLGHDSLEGCKIADWMIEHDMDLGGKWIPQNFEFYAHSRNSVRVEYINGTLERYLRYRETGL